MFDIVALVASNDSRAQIIGAIGRRAKVHLVSSPRELADVVSSARPRAVICEFSSQTAAGTVAVVRELRASQPTLPMIGYCWVEPSASRHLMIAARAGVSALALRGVDDVGMMLEHVLVEAEADCVSTQVAAALDGRVSALVLDALDFCIRRARDLPDVPQLADALRLPRRTLAHRLRRAGAPHPEALISWSRLFIAAELLMNERRSVDHAALALGFGSGSALRGMLQRYAEVTPQELRLKGGLRHLLARFLASQAIALPTVYEELPTE